MLFLLERVLNINRGNYNMRLKDKEIKLYFVTQSFMRVFYALLI